MLPINRSRPITISGCIHHSSPISSKTRSRTPSVKYCHTFNFAALCKIVGPNKPTRCLHRSSFISATLRYRKGGHDHTSYTYSARGTRTSSTNRLTGRSNTAGRVAPRHSESSSNIAIHSHVPARKLPLRNIRSESQSPLAARLTHSVAFLETHFSNSNATQLRLGKNRPVAIETSRQYSVPLRRLWPVRVA